jgi:hypothetical protein
MSRRGRHALADLEGQQLSGVWSNNHDVLVRPDAQIIYKPSVYYFCLDSTAVQAKHSNELGLVGEAAVKVPVRV